MNCKVAYIVIGFLSVDDVTANAFHPDVLFDALLGKMSLAACPFWTCGVSADSVVRCRPKSLGTNLACGLLALLPITRLFATVAVAPVIFLPRSGQ